MQEKLLTLLNLVLIAVCGASVYYLYTAQYTKPDEIARMESTLRKLNETEFGTALTNETPMNPQTSAMPPWMNKDPFAPIFTPTPTPTPTPSPTPAPPPISELVASWKIMALNDDSAEFFDERTSENFTLSVGGEPRMAVDKTKKEFPVQLDSVDLNEFKAIVSFGAQKFAIAY